MRLMSKEINSVLLLLLLQQFGLVQSQRHAGVQIISFGYIHLPPMTRKFCAVTHANVTQNNKKLIDCSVQLSRCSVKLKKCCNNNSINCFCGCKKLTDCSYECAKSEECVGFNFKEAQPVCELFQTTFTSLSPTAGCTYYEVCRNIWCI